MSERRIAFKMRGMVGVRAFGWQADITNHRTTPPYFSERYRGQYGIEKTPRLHVGPLCFRVTKLRALYGPAPQQPMSEESGE